jgi:hypothetical protein
MLYGRRFVSKLYFLSFIFFFQIAYTQEYHSIGQRNLSEEAFKVGYYYLNNMDYEASINFFRKSISLFPNNNNAYYWLGKAYLLAGYKDQAINTWEELQKLNGGDLFIKEQLNNLYSEPLKQSRNFLPNSNYLFLRYFDTGANPSSIEVDHNNRFYLTDYYSNKIDIYNSNLHKIFTIKSGIDKPTYISFGKQLMFVSCFGSDTVKVYDVKTYKKLFDIGGFGFENGKLAGPAGTTYYNNKLFIADQSNNRIQIFQLTPKPYFVATFGKKGQGAGEFFSPTSIAIYNNNIWVVDKGNNRLQVFDLNGNFLYQIKDPVIKDPSKILVYQTHLLVVDEIGGLFIYDEGEKSFRLIKKPSDGIERLTSAALDKNGVLFFAEFTNPRVVSYIIDSGKLNSLNLQTLLLSKAAKPDIVMKIRVKDSEGKDIQGLTDKNFNILQDGVKMKNVKLAPLKPQQDKMVLTVIVRDFDDMKPYEKNISDYLQKLLSELKGPDKLRLIAYNTTSTQLLDFASSKIKFMESLKKISFSETKKTDIFDSVLYKAIHDTNFNDSHNAILVLDNANREEDFAHYSLEVLGNFSKNLGVPIFIVKFSQEGALTDNFDLLANITQGKALSYFESSDIFNIISYVKNEGPLFYTLSYKAPLYEKKESVWTQVIVHLNYRSLSGVDRLGYYLP